MLRITSEITDRAIHVDSFGWALLTALIASAVMIVLETIFGTNDDDTYTIRVIQRIAKRGGDQERTDAPGILFLEIDGLALPVLRRAMRDGNAPVMASWVEQGTHRLVEWETDFSSQTGASQTGSCWLERRRPRLPLGGQADGRVYACSGPADCAEIEPGSRTAAACCGTAARAGATCSPARPTT